jgi:hypothetical protein
MQKAGVGNSREYRYRCEFRRIRLPSPPRITLDDAHTTGVEVDGGGDTHYVRDFEQLTREQPERGAKGAPPSSVACLTLIFPVLSLTITAHP